MYLLKDFALVITSLARHLVFLGISREWKSDSITSAAPMPSALGSVALPGCCPAEWPRRMAELPLLPGREWGSLPAAGHSSHLL